MLEKNIEKEERKRKRKPPIPFTRKTPTKHETQLKQRKKHPQNWEEQSQD